MINTEVKKTLLMIFPAMPYPLRSNGLSMRYLPIIRYFSRNYIIDIIVLDDKNTCRENVDELKGYCRRVSIISNPLNGGYSIFKKFVKRVNVLLPWNPPIYFAVYYGDYILHKIKELTSGVHYDTLIWTTSHYSGYLLYLLKFVSRERTIVDFVDSPFLAVKRKVISLNSCLLQHYEYWKTLRWEAKIIRNSTSSIYISSVDAGAVPSRLTSGCKRYVIPNGISAETYTDYIDKKVKSPNIGFLGNMEYAPNVESVHWLYEHVFLPLRSEIQNLSLYVIGKNPVRSIKELALKEGVFITGEVANIWPIVNAIDVFVFPLWNGIGLKNKLLEAMYAKRPVVTTPIGNEGIEAVQHRDLLICNSEEEFQHEVLRLLYSPNKRAILGESGHKFVTENYSWERILREFEAVITGSI